MKAEYIQDAKIDDQQLDVEWLEQAELGIKYGKLWALAKRDLQIANREREKCRSLLITQANSDPDKFLGTGVKPTVGNVEAFYRNHPKFIAATEEVDEATHALDLAEVAKKEISITRKNALTALTELMTSNYFAGPSTPRNLQEIREERRKERQVKIRNRFRKEKDEE